MYNKIDVDFSDITVSLGDVDWAYDDEYVTFPKVNHNEINLDGEDADIIIDGISLKKTLQGLNDRLAILHVNPELEAEFDELHSLAEQYRALEKKLIEKKAVWEALNKS